MNGFEDFVVLSAAGMLAGQGNGGVWAKLAAEV
jgi:hypothetical protein